MINKLVDQVSTDLVDFFKKYNIPITAQYTPELPGIVTYSRNFLARTMSANPISIDGSIYQNKLLYRVAGIKLAENAPHNNTLAVLTGFEQVGQQYEITSSGNNIVKLRTSLDEGAVKVRDASIIEIPIEFVVITESLELIHALSLLFYQRLQLLSALTVELDLFSSGTPIPIDYLMTWDRDSLEISYANFEDSRSLNTVSFSMKLRGAGFSEFYYEDRVINEINANIGLI